MRCICMNQCGATFYLASEGHFSGPPHRTCLRNVSNRKVFVTRKCWKSLIVSCNGKTGILNAKPTEFNEQEQKGSVSNEEVSRLSQRSKVLNEEVAKNSRNDDFLVEKGSLKGTSPVLGTLDDEVYSSVESDEGLGARVLNPNGLNELKLEEENTEYVTKLPVSRQKYISVSKMALVQSLMSRFPNKEDASNFLSICTRLESILHAEHRLILEELRLDYKSACLSEEDNLVDGIHLKQGKVTGNDVSSPKEEDGPAKSGVTNGAAIGAYIKSSNRSSVLKEADNSSKTLAARFQQNLMLILKTAQFQELSARDLQLTTALNSNYLLTLPIDVDWKSASSADVIVFRRGYVTETQTGLLFGEKFDYLQSVLLRKIFSGVAEPLFRAGRWCIQKWKLAEKSQHGKGWIESVKQWLEEPLYPYLEEQEVLTTQNQVSPTLESDQNGGEDYDLPFRLAARRSVPRYEAVLTSAGSRGILLKRFLIWIGLLPPNTANFPSLSNDDSATSKSNGSIRPNYLSRISMRDIWLPASRSVCGGSIWQRVKASIGIFFSSSTLQEPAFGELVVLYTKSFDTTKKAVMDGFPWLQLNIYEKLPIPDLKVVFPNKKLSFRIVDTVRLDFTTLVGIIAFLVNHKFVDFLSSPSAFLLDLIATVSLLVFASRVVFGYKQTLDRYQLLVNKTLYEKTLASRFGVVHFLVDASEEQQFKEMVLAYAMLQQILQNQATTPWQQLKDACENYLYDQFKVQIEMPMENVIKNLVRLGLARLEYEQSTTLNTSGSKEVKLQVVPTLESLEALERKWSDLLTSEAVLSTTIIH